MSAHGGKEMRIGRNGGGKEPVALRFSALSDGGTELCLALSGGGKDLRIGPSGDPLRRPAPTLAPGAGVL